MSLPCPSVGRKRKSEDFVSGELLSRYPSPRPDPEVPVSPSSSSSYSSTTGENALKCRRTKSFRSLAGMTSNGTTPSQSPTPEADLLLMPSPCDGKEATTKGRSVSVGSASSMVASSAPPVKHQPMGNWGWFIKMDSDSVPTPLSQRTVSCHDLPSVEKGLAFVKPRTNTRGESQELDADVKWASAADTVDAVLGDLPDF